MPSIKAAAEDKIRGAYEFKQGFDISKLNFLDDTEYITVGNVWVTPHDVLRTKFGELDEDEDQKLNRDELLELCEHIGYPADKLDDMIMHYDEDGDGAINFDEFCCMFYPEWEAFEVVSGTPGNEYNNTITDEEEQGQYDAGLDFNDTTFHADENLDPEFEDSAVLVRAPKLIPLTAGRPRLFTGIDPHDINQGGLGDCWLLCALAAMAEFPGLIQSCFRNKRISNKGKYEVKIWDGEQWNGVIIDDQIPAIGNTFGADEPIFARPNRGELWVVLLEKALAKWVGGYSNLEGGQDFCAWRLLIGRDDCEVLEQNEDGVWQRKPVEWLGAKHIDCSFGDGVDVSEDQIWDIIENWESQNSVLGAATWKGESTGEKGFSGGEEMRADNIVQGHAYSILQMTEFKDHNLKLIQLRNPWGNEMEWNGRWSDGSDEWDEYEDVANRLGIGDKDDGMFWMEFSDFLDVFERVSMCPHEMPVARRSEVPPSSSVAKPYKRSDKGCKCCVQ